MKTLDKTDPYDLSLDELADVLADDERDDLVGGLKLLEDGEFQIGEFHGCFAFVSVVGKWHCETSCVNL